MKNKLSQKVVNLKPSGIRKFFDIALEVKGVISLGVGEPDFDTPWHIREEGIYTLEKGKTIYTSNAGLIELREEIANYYSSKYNVKYDHKDEVLVTVGGSEGIDLFFRSVINNGDEVIIPTPSYVAYEPCATLSDAKIVTIPLKEENEFRLTKEELLQAITANTKVLVLPFPNNPTGSILRLCDLNDIAKICIEKDILVLSDEIYSELTYDNTHISIASLPNMKERTVVINGFSKSYSMTGWRLGYAMGPKDIIEQMTKIHQYAIMCAPTNSQYAAISALKNGDKDIAKMRDAYNQRRRYLINALKNMGLDCFTPYGAFYVFPNITKFNMTSEEFATRLLKEAKVVVVPGTAFGESGEGFVRISYAYSIDDLKRALDRIEQFIKKL